MWKYQLLLNQNLQILITIGVGFIVTFLGPFRQKTDLGTLVKVVFNILLPSSVLLALGIRSDLRNGDLWRFIGGFLLLRAICLLVNALYYGLVKKKNLAFITICWMNTCWVSTVVLGIPLLGATLGAQYASLGAVAGISSFIFQLPLMLIFFEGSTSKRSTGLGEPSSSAEQGNGTIEMKSSPGAEQVASNDSGDTKEQMGEAGTPMEVSSPNNAVQGEELANQQSKHQQWYHLHLSRAQMIYIMNKILRNPILWAIVIGIILSVTTLGPRYLNPGTPASPNCDYAVGAGFITLSLEAFARCTEPIALLAIGIFLVNKNPVACGVINSIMYMVIKLILVPGLMVGCAFAVGLKGAEGRAAVLLAALPVSPAAYAMSERYGIGQEISESNIFFGNLLVLPTTIAWVSFMDGIDLFNAPAPPSPTTGC
jgi:predicted permease